MEQMYSIWVPYHEPSAEKARKLAEGCKTPLAKYKVITDYVTRCFAYDYIKAVKVAKKRGVLPDVEHVWKLHMGICQDIAAMTVGMLRAVDIEAYLCIGTIGGRIHHAWVEAIIDGKVRRYDHDGEAPEYKEERRY